ncbi:MAG TPA: hypothetical protein VEC18_11975 [Myxococcota bacterium]|nr:hypothetical protein [Myxococcota bacterium]
MRSPTIKRASRLASVFALIACSRASALATGAVDVAPSEALQWRPLGVDVADDTASALALDREGKLAVGDSRGVAMGVPGGAMLRVALRGGVLDLAFVEGTRDGERALLAATPLGLYRVLADGSVESSAPAPGPQANAVARVAAVSGVVAAATEAGAFISPDARRWQRLSPALPSGAAAAIALAARDGFVECWVAIRGELWRGEIREHAGRLVASAPHRVAIPYASSQRVPVDVVLDVGEAAVAVVFESELLVRRRAPAQELAVHALSTHEASDAQPQTRDLAPGAVPAGEASDAARTAAEPFARESSNGTLGGWELLRPTLPPGAAARRLVAALGRYWLATDRGLLVAAELRGPWRRALGASGSDAVFDLEVRDDALYAATDNGIAAAQLEPAGAAAQPDPRDAAAPLEPAGASATQLPQPVVDPREPDVQSVQRAAMRYLDLEPERIAELRRGVSRRGWLPILAFRATHDDGHNRHFDRDESFVAGEMRRFHARDRDTNRDLELQVSLSWDFGDVAFHPESIDVSREAREIIELRDDVLDEVTQLYFERRRALAEAAAHSGSPAAAEQRLRAAQLAAGIDAWTGGWYARQLAEPSR